MPLDAEIKKPLRARQSGRAKQQTGGGQEVGEPLRTFVHDVANPLAAIAFAAGALRASKVLTERELADVRRAEEAAMLVGQMVDRLVARPEIFAANGQTSGSSARKTVDLYALCCELAARRRNGGATLHCRAHGDPRGRWDRRQLAHIVSRMLDQALGDLDQNGAVTVVVTGMARHVRLDVHGVRPLGPRKLRALRNFPATIEDQLGGTLTATITSNVMVITLRLPR